MMTPLNKTIGKYQIVKLIGDGGMSSVFEAEHEMLGSKVAIKILNPILSINEVVRDRFKNEARIMASLNHPNIARIIDFDEQPQQLSIIMELLEGEDLNSRVRNQGPLKDIELKSTFIQILRALQYAHEKGVIHRDIKPSNIYLLPDGQVKILDFGIAKVYGQGIEMTQTGQQIGTPVYMSPEQVRSEKNIDHRTDIYSLGVTMFYSLCGINPYDSSTESQFDILTKIVNDPIPDLKMRFEYNSIIYKACAKDRNHRFQDCREWIELISSETKSSISPNYKIIENGNGNQKIDNNDDETIISKNIITNIYFNNYQFPSIRIGNQCWMSKNLNVDRFRNGDPILFVTSEEEWKLATKSNQPAFCYYNFNQYHQDLYAKLYNWHAVNDPRGIAPTGWNIPSIQDWSVLIDFLGGDKVAGRKLKSTTGWDFSWQSWAGDNSSGFDGSPSGYIIPNYSNGEYLGKKGFWWSSTNIDLETAWGYSIENSSQKIYQTPYRFGCGLSIRCIQINNI